MNEYLSAIELCSLTACARATKQAEWLRSHGIPHLLDGKRVVVSRVHVLARLEGKQTPISAGPNWAAVA